MAAAETVKTTCPRDCYDACGITVTRKNGIIANVLGDKDHAISRGALCLRMSAPRGHPQAPRGLPVADYDKTPCGAGPV